MEVERRRLCVRAMCRGGVLGGRRMGTADTSALQQLLLDLLGKDLLGLRVVPGEVLLVVALALGDLVGVHAPAGELPHLGRKQVDEDAAGDDPPLVADADELEYVISEPGNVDDGEL